MMPEAYVAVLAAMFAGGALLVVAGLRGTAAAPGDRPASAPTRMRRRSGGGRTSELRRLIVAGGVVTGLVVLALTGSPALSLLAAVAVPVAGSLWSGSKKEQRAIQRAEAVGEWTRRLKDQLATGSGLTAAVVASAQTAPPPIAGHVAALANRIRGGMRPQRALHQFAVDVDDTVAEQVVAALLLHLEDRGEHLSEVLNALSADAAAVVATRREVDAKRAQPRMTVRFMIVFAGVVTALMAGSDLLAAYRAGTGQVVLLVLAGAFIAVLAWVNAMSRPAQPQRFLAAEVG